MVYGFHLMIMEKKIELVEYHNGCGLRRVNFPDLTKYAKTILPEYTGMFYSTRVAHYPLDKDVTYSKLVYYFNSESHKQALLITFDKTESEQSMIEN